MIVLKSYMSSMGPQKLIEEQNFDSSIVDALMNIQELDE